MKRNGLLAGAGLVSGHEDVWSKASSLSRVVARFVQREKTLAYVAALTLALMGIACGAALPVRALGRLEVPVMPGVIQPRDLPKLDGDPVSIDHRAAMEREATFPTGRLTVVLETTDGITYAGTESAGLYKTEDGGDTWTRLTDNMGLPMPNLTVTALAQGDDSDEIYVAVGYWLGTSEAHFAPLGVYASRDGGESWHAMEGEAPARSIVAMAVDVDNPNAVLAVTENSEEVILYVL